MQTIATEWQAWLKRRIGLKPRAVEAPLRAELLGGEQLERHARAVAAQHRAVTRKHPNRLLADLTENERNLRAFNRATLAVTPARRITPAAEWLLDNFYLIEEQIQMARRHLPRGYSRELPCLSGGGSAGLPRIYDLVLELIAHVDAQVDAGPLLAFVAAYQTVTPLKLGELWAIPIMLRLGLIENLERVTRRLVVARADRDAADLCADRLQAMAEEDPSRVIVVVADMADADLPLSSSFVAEFCQRLARLSPELHIARTWLDQRLAGLGLSLDLLVQQESQSQAADQVSVSHSIASLRSLGATDWKSFVESLSVVEAVLRTDPAGVYATMDFATRDRYRHAAEAIARHSGVAEAEVARQAVGLAENGARERGSADRTAHVGYHLIDRGQERLAELTRVRRPLRDRVERAILRFPLACYAGGIAAGTALASAGAVAAARARGVDGGALVAVALVVLPGTSQLAVALVNRLSALLVRPRLLPRLDFSAGIAAGCRTIVVVPTMLTGAESIDRLLETMEIHALGNRDPLLHFALLTDLPDAPEAVRPGDAALVERARAGVERLNARYPGAQGDHFFLFHRPRRWNAAERRWMGYERKRGKLEDFNALLRGGARGSFAVVAGDAGGLGAVRYVITLDSDTQLPRDAARRLIGTMAHPLNRPVFDPVRGIVGEGYGILQPRVGVSLPGARRSWFVRLMAGDAGIDPYTQEVSDVYQDLFAEGSFIGKGIYDVDAFRRAMAGRCPENAVLSHDLLESCHVRSALVSDVEFYEEHPSRHDVDSGRRHRWIRGDWQITPWLLPRVPGADARRTANPLSALSRWKIFDNLRRSLVPVALLAILLGGWLAWPATGGAATGLLLAMIALPGALAAGVEACRRPAELPWLVHGRSVAATGTRHLGQLLLTLAFLPYDAFVSLDAIGRTLLRLGFTRRRLLEWQTSSEREETVRSGLADFFRSMWISPAVGLATGGLLAAFRPEQVLQAWPLLGLWLAAPGIAWRISQPIRPEAPDLSAEERRFLRTVARKTWSFFETFVTARENWLPPDNFQEVPVPTVASRTSPTNLGLALLANLAARDLGYVPLGGLVRRTQATLGTMQGLGRFRGHFFNWYDTRTLQPLPPLYVSSVDSGNLAGHLLTLAAGLREQAGEKIHTPRAGGGLRDTVQVLRELLPGHVAAADLDRFEAATADATPGLRAGHAMLEAATAQAEALARRLAGEPAEVRRWAELLRLGATEHLDELRATAPWLVGTRAGGTSPADAGDAVPTLGEIAAWAEPGAEATEAGGDEARQAAARRARGRLAELEALAAQCEALAAMDFRFLFNAKRDLFCTGFDVADRRFDGGFYDLLASEARLGSYVAIALGQVPQEHWFSLGRLLAAPNGDPVLISWSGSMFEYLMPLLVMPSYENTLLDRTCRAAVRQQIEYGRRCGVPWGISESGYNRTDVQFNYQYRAFGVPGLGLKRGLAGDLVVAPYAAVMALTVAPREACDNLRRLAREGQAGPHGFYEAVDYTPGRLPPGETRATIRSFMAHHQGMSLLALVNFLEGNPMPRRFMASPVLQTADLLLQERVPKAATRVLEEDPESEIGRIGRGEGADTRRVFTTPSPAAPEVHLLSNGRYHVAITSAGGGYSRWRDLAVTRWREDGTRDCWGTFVYLRDTEGGDFWSAAHQPTLRPTKAFEASFTPSRADFRHRQAGLEVHTEVAVSPEDDIEIRRITVTNRTAAARVIELTSYAEVVLAPPAADASHPAFGNLFVQTEFVRDSAALLCTRRARSPEEVPPWLLHLAPVQGGAQGAVSCETDRARFVGRGGTTANPAAMRRSGPLSDTVGSVLDPIMALRRTVAIGPHEAAVVVFVVGVAAGRESALALVHKYQDARMAERVFDLAWTHSQVELRQLNATEAEAQIYARLAGALIYADPVRRAEPGVLRANRRGQSALWAHGVSGDVPLVLLRAGDPQKIEMVRQVIQAHAYWRTKGLVVELVILSDDVSVYRQSLHDQIAGMVATGIGAPLQDRPGGIFVRRFEQLSGDDRTLLQAVARIVLDDARGSLAEQLDRRGSLEAVIPPLVPTRTGADEGAEPATAAADELIFQNGLGGFTRDGREYVIVLEPGRTTPAPWVNVIANPGFGTVVSESGGGYTWAENAHEFRLTPWSNDPVQDTAGEALYVRDEQTGQFWSPMPGPARGATRYTIRHGFGYSVFGHTEHGIASEVRVHVAGDAPVKFTTVTLRNRSGRPRRLSVTGYWEWVLGDVRAKTLLHVQTEIDARTGALLAANPYNADFAGRIVFVDAGEGARAVTGDRREFLGRNGGPDQPAALKRARLSGKVGAGLDACGAVQIAVDLADGEERELVFRLGVGRTSAEVQDLVLRFRRPDAARAALDAVRAQWDRTLGAVAVETPDPAVNVMANGWLVYQTLGARVWGRTGFYQSGGAYGFRDQLQDVMALMHAAPTLAREHLLRAAGRQFREGDVQHWWHPPAGRGVRTHCSDDFLWLPYATCRYVECSADAGVLDETAGFLEGRAVKVDEEAYYDLPGRPEGAATLYDHCVLAIRRGLAVGAHGLPLIGCGDWNDGMNAVGRDGRGESVWLAFFLTDVLARFAPLARGRGDAEFADLCLAHAELLRTNIERHGWDGDWYRRAYFDDGTPLGSALNPECQIDSLPQSWAVISGAGDPARARQAMAAVERRLVRRAAGLVQLFDPPFDRSALDPGYIKGYIPGVRENGGQYTHGAVWAAMAFALLGDTDRAWALFNLLNPVRHGGTPEQIAVYKVEPYVVAADVYAVAPHVGRGGWTWYTGSAGWMYRLLVETLLGVNREGDRLRLSPRMPKTWRSYRIRYRHGSSSYRITFTAVAAGAGADELVTLDGRAIAGTTVPLSHDGAEHTVEMKVPAGWTP